MNILSTLEETNIVFLAIRSYKPEQNSIFNLLSTNIYQGIMQKLNKEDIHISTQDIYDTFSECFDHYNAFVKQKQMDLPILTQEHYDMLASIINDIVDELIKIEFKELIESGKKGSN